MDLDQVAALLAADDEPEAEQPKVTAEPEKPGDEEPEGDDDVLSQEEEEETEEAEEVEDDDADEDLTVDDILDNIDPEDFLDKLSPEQLEKWSKRLHSGAVKRISKLNSKAKAAEAELQQAKALIAQQTAQLQQSQTASKQSGNLFTNVNNEGDLNRMIGDYKQFKSSIKAAINNATRQHLDDDDKVTVEDGSGNRKEVAVKDLPEYESIVDRIIDSDIPNRREFLKQRAATTDQAIKALPWLGNAKSDEDKALFQAFNSIYSMHKSYLDDQPAGVLIAGMAAKGLMGWQRENAKKPEVKPESKKVEPAKKERQKPNDALSSTPAATVPKSQPTTKKQKKVQALKSHFNKSGRIDDLAALFAAESD